MARMTAMITLTAMATTIAVTAMIAGDRVRAGIARYGWAATATASAIPFARSMSVRMAAYDSCSSNPTAAARWITAGAGTAPGSGRTTAVVANFRWIGAGNDLPRGRASRPA